MNTKNIYLKNVVNSFKTTNIAGFLIFIAVSYSCKSKVLEGIIVIYLFLNST